MSTKRKGVVRIDEALCKGCEICVHFCPTKTLEMRNFKVAVANPESCIGCMMCELRCPDFAISVDLITSDKGADA